MRFISLKPPATSSPASSADSKNTRYSSVTSIVTAVDAAAAALGVDSYWGFVAVATAVASLLTAVITVALEPLVPSCAAPRLPVAEPVYSADAVYDQVRESTVLAVENAKHAVGMA